MNTKIQELVYKMMTTNTGVALCDSGGDDGRHWQRNKRDYPTIDAIKKAPEVEVDAVDVAGDSADMVPTVSLFHYLTNALTLDETCEAFNALPCDDWDSEDAYGVSVAQVEWLRSHGLTIKGTWNSYNGESNLSQVVQGASVAVEGDALEYPTYILLQVHQGADVRGGYTDAKLFKIADGVDYFSTNPSVYGTIDGIDVSTGHNGYDLRDDNGDAVPVTPESVIILSVESF